MTKNILETLPSEIIGELLSKLPTIETLFAAIRASRYANECFKEQKEHILQCVLFNDLGPVIRDAIFGEYQSNIPLCTDDDGEATEMVSTEYERVLERSTCAELRQRASPEIVRKIIKRLNLFQKITNFLMDVILADIAVVDLGAAWRPTLAERQRFLQALFRYSAILRYDLRELESDVSDHVYFQHPCLRMFRAWELQQISDMAGYIGNMWQAVVFGSRDDSAAEQKDAETISLNRRDNWKNAEYDLKRIWERAEDAMTSVDGFSEVLLNHVRRREMRRMVVRILVQSNLLWYGEEEWRTAEERERTQVRASGVENPSNPPFAWDDAAEGEPWTRWGLLLLEQPPGNRPGRPAVNEEMQWRWRWFGFNFWDEERVVRLKQCAHFSALQTGWFSHAS